jgi:hypothetical protein
MFGYRKHRGEKSRLERLHSSPEMGVWNKLTVAAVKMHHNGRRVAEIINMSGGNKQS